VQASSVRSLASYGRFSQSCGVQMAMLSPLNAERLWCKCEVRHQGKTIASSVRELNTDTTAQMRYSTADIWAWDQELRFDALEEGLYEVMFYVGATRDSIGTCHGVSAIYLAAPPGSPRGVVRRWKPSYVDAPSTSSGCHAVLLHILPYTNCQVNESGGYDLLQASSVRSLDSYGPFSQSCGVQMAVLTPLNAERLWCKCEVRHQGNTIATSVQELNTDTSVQMRYSTADIWAWDLGLSFMVVTRGLYDLLVYMSTTPHSFAKCHGRSTIYLNAFET